MILWYSIAGLVCAFLMLCWGLGQCYGPGDMAALGVTVFVTLLLWPFVLLLLLVLFCVEARRRW